MAAVCVEAISATIQRFDQVQSFDASSTSFADSVLVETNHNRGPMIFSNKPRRHDAKHARVPAARARYDGRVASRVELAVYSLYCCIDDLLFYLLAFAILLVEFPSKHCCFAFVLCKQQAQGFLRRAQTPRSIQSRAKAVANIFGQDWHANS